MVIACVSHRVYYTGDLEENELRDPFEQNGITMSEDERERKRD